VPVLCNVVFLFNALGVREYAENSLNYHASSVFVASWLAYIVICTVFPYRKKPDRSAEVFIRRRAFRVVLLAFFFLVIAFAYYLNGVPMLSENPDLARFEQQNMPLGGVLFRVIYWVLPFFSILLMHVYKDDESRRYQRLFFILSLIAVFLCGSKGALMQFILCHLIYFRYVGINIFSTSRIVYLTVVATFVVAGTIYLTAKYSESDDYMQAANILYSRVTTGAGEGFYIVATDYVPINGYGGGWFTFVKPVYTFGSTLRILPKNELSFDSGNYIGMHYRGIHNLAPYTYTIFGQGYLDFGFFGAVAFSSLFALVVSGVHFAILSEKNPVKKCFKISVGWSLISLANWGYLDGWFVYSFLMITVAYWLSWIFWRQKAIDDFV